ncbi:hypothetical protein [Allomesorhizobium camelthorni]|uniref:Uncharacterized protein n=1 Tax=Allomesorhizobium camelthorni TaxID=475069 RepID=A0A6G4WN28_9HYPH|nr:hypothetical protein [Mesorhizobium camelthorni]NGO55778.1 hypothetical protein [Mesorhizobium camelthorni]
MSQRETPTVDPLLPRPERSQLPLSRRDVMLGSAAFLSASGPISAAQANPNAEGYFLTVGDDRIFFIRSEWLVYFEVTALVADQTKLHRIVRKISRHSKKKQSSALYIDDVPGDASERLRVIDPQLGSLMPTIPPTSGHTYLAMMVDDG